MKLTKPSVVRDLLSRHGLNPKKGLGQNFLVDENYLEKIVAAAALSSEDVVLEVGPGLGTLTSALAARAGQVIAIEKDESLQPLLQETLGSLPNVTVIYSDALKVSLTSLIGEARGPLKVVANLPYYITSPLIFKFLDSGLKWESLVFLVQLEVAERMIAKPGKKDYGSLSVAVQSQAGAEIVAQVPPGAFYPPPKVASAVVRLQPRSTALERLEVPQEYFSAVVRAAFGQRRKTMVNGVAAGLGMDRQLVKEGVVSLGWPEDRRGETLSVEEFVELANKLGALKERKE